MHGMDCARVCIPHLPPRPEIVLESRGKTKINEKGYLCVKITAKKTFLHVYHTADTSTYGETQCMNEKTHLARHNGSVQQTAICICSIQSMYYTQHIRGKAYRNRQLWSETSSSGMANGYYTHNLALACMYIVQYTHPYTHPYTSLASNCSS